MGVVRSMQNILSNTMWHFLGPFSVGLSWVIFLSEKNKSVQIKLDINGYLWRPFTKSRILGSTQDILIIPFSSLSSWFLWRLFQLSRTWDSLILFSTFVIIKWGTNWGGDGDLKMGLMTIEQIPHHTRLKLRQFMGQVFPFGWSLEAYLPSETERKSSFLWACAFVGGTMNKYFGGGLNKSHLNELWRKWRRLGRYDQAPYIIIMSW